MMAYVTEEQIVKAKQLDLLTYLETFEPDELVRLSNRIYSTKSHDSVVIRNGAWFRNSTGDYGFTALDYLVKVYGIPFVQAVEQLSGERAVESAGRRDVFYRAEPPEQKVLRLPPRYYNNKIGIAYLENRGISRDVINFCIQTNRLYESKPYHNPVFLGVDSKGKPRFAISRCQNWKRRYLEAKGSDKRFAFSIPAETESDKLIVFESAIDLLSYCTLSEIAGEDWRKFHLLSLSGIYIPQKGKKFTQPKALEWYLKAYPNINQITLLLDGDEKGRIAVGEISKSYEREYAVKNTVLPDDMDVNDLLQNYRKNELGKEKSKNLEDELLPA